MIVRRESVIFSIGLWIILCSGFAVPAQYPSGQQPSTEQQQSESARLEEKAVILLEQVVSESQTLRLPENRVRIQIIAGNMLWDRDQSKARSLFSGAAAGIIEMMQSMDNDGRDRFDRQNFYQIRVSTQLRQELLLAVAKHDAALAYQLLAMTRPAPAPEGRNTRRPNAEANLEQSLLAQIAALDPKLALQNAETMLDKRQYSNSLARVLSQLQTRDRAAAAMLGERMLKQLQSEDLVANREAINLSFSLLQPGPQPAEAQPGNAKPGTNAAQVLNQSNYQSLLETVVAAAVKTTIQPAGNQRTQGAQTNSRPRGGRNNTRGRQTGLPATSQSELSDAEIEQNNARTLLMGLQSILPQIDQYLPSRAQAVRQKLSEAGVPSDRRIPFNQLDNLIQQGTSDALLAAAASAPPGMQSRLYQQSALKALSEGNIDRARQIANERLDPTLREAVLQTIDFQVAGGDAKKVQEVRQTLARLRSDEERVNLLLQISNTVQKGNPQLALQFLVEAQSLVSRRAGNYQQLESQLNVSRALSALAPSRSYELLELGIGQLNDLFSAAAMLNGFEVNIFKDGELSFQGGSMLTNMAMRYGQELALLSKNDFERAQTLADKFQNSEPRIYARLSIACVALGGEPIQALAGGFGAGRGFGPFMRGRQ